MKNSVVIVGLICLFLVPAVGFCSEKEASIERDVVPGGPGGNRLEVDVDLLAGAAEGFHDLRLFSASSEEVPYLLPALLWRTQLRGSSRYPSLRPSNASRGPR